MNSVIPNYIDHIIDYVLGFFGALNFGVPLDRCLDNM